MNAKELLKSVLLNVIDSLDVGNSEISDEQCLDLARIINETTNTRTKLSKYQACKYLNVSRATFDNWIREGRIPKGRKEQGFKELFWEVKDLKNGTNK